MRALAVAATLLLLAHSASAGGVHKVAGSAFDANARGKPLTWPEGAIHYYTDQGALSDVLDQDAANAFVADAFSRWTAINTAAVSATRDGSLAQDVNAETSAAGLPADILPSATSKPVAIVYDRDGAVIDSLFGSGASAPTLCRDNAVFGGNDAMLASGHYSHALLILNGRCVNSTSQLTAFRYRLMRAIGRLFGLGWSQLNNAPSTTADFAGLPLMQAGGSFCDLRTAPDCLPNPGTPRMDDRAALSALYPVTAANSATFPGKQLTAASTARLRGTVRFCSLGSSPAWPMQGVNVVARRIDPVSGQPSREFAAASVSGFLFRGMAGNSVNGPLAADGSRYDSYGSSDPALQGFFDLAALEPGAGSAAFQISVEALDPLYIGSLVVGPYVTGQITPAGSFSPIVSASLSAGSDIEQDIIFSCAAAHAFHRGELSAAALPSRIPPSGVWLAHFHGYGNEDHHYFDAKAGHTFTAMATALDGAGSPSRRHAQPEIGVKRFSDAPGAAPLFAAPFFNGSALGRTEVSDLLPETRRYRILFADARGDGRPDLAYLARLLYLDSVAPARILDSSGKKVVLTGIGLNLGLQAFAGETPLQVLHADGGSAVVALPAGLTGTLSLSVVDPASGATSAFANALTFGFQPGDTISVVSSNSAQAPVGSTVVNAARFRVRDSASQVIANAPVTVSATAPNTLQCGASACNLVTDALGEVAANVSLNAAGTVNLLATLANGASQTVQLTAVSTANDFAGMNTVRNFMAGSAVSADLTTRRSSSGAPVAGTTVTYSLVSGAASFLHRHHQCRGHCLDHRKLECPEFDRAHSSLRPGHDLRLLLPDPHQSIEHLGRGALHAGAAHRPQPDAIAHHLPGARHRRRGGAECPAERHRHSLPTAPGAGMRPGRQLPFRPTQTAGRHPHYAHFQCRWTRQLRTRLSARMGSSPHGHHRHAALGHTKRHRDRTGPVGITAIDVCHSERA